MANAMLIALAQTAAKAHGLELPLVCAVVEQESAWNPWAYRYEPAFYKRYIVPLIVPLSLPGTESLMRATSWGLMQLMGQVAREMGFANIYLSSLCDPATGLDWGCQHLARKIAKADGDIHAGLQLWNGGGNPTYGAEVLARLPNYPEAV